MLRIDFMHRLPTSALSDVEKAILIIDEFKNLPSQVSYTPQGVLRENGERLMGALDLLNEVADDDGWDDEQVKVIYDHIETASKVLNETDKAWQLLRYGRYIEQEY